MDSCIEASEYNDILQVVDINNLQKILHVEDELGIGVLDMTSLGTLMLLEQKTSQLPHDNNEELLDEYTDLKRVSLAYERLHSMPNILLDEFSSRVQILDLSNNEFEKLDFLKDFNLLTHLICDHNKISSNTSLPFLPKLELLWLNHCKIAELYPWARNLQHSAPNLQFLSLMGNPVAPTCFNKENYEYENYRLFLISLFPKLLHLDDKAVTLEEKKEAQKLYHRPFVSRLIIKTQQSLPQYVRIASEKLTDFLTPPPPFANNSNKKNVII